MQLSDLNQFKVVSIAQGADIAVLAGRLRYPGQMGTGNAGLVVGDQRAIVGNIRIDPDAGTGAFEVTNKDLALIADANSTFPLVDPYYLSNIWLVLDARRVWTRTRFVARDAFEQPAETPGWHVSREATAGDESDLGGKIVAGGWDHEHCELCWAKIGCDGAAVGYSSDTRWVCIQCYDSFIVPRDLRFVVDGPWPSESQLSAVFFQLERLINAYDLRGFREYVEGGGDINARNPNGWTALMVAAMRGQMSLVALLLKLGAELNAVGKHGEGAVGLAAQQGHIEIVSLLLRANADVRVGKECCGGSLLGYVMTGPGRENQRLIQLLREAGAE